MTVVTVHQAKTNLSRLIKKASNGEEVIIARGSKPVARLGACRPLTAHRSNWLKRPLLYH